MNISYRGRMSIVCGVDFSDASLQAVRVAAALAAAAKLPLYLVHATEPAADEGAADRARTGFRNESLAARARALRERGIDVRSRVEVGVPDQVLSDFATEVAATLIVIGPVGHRRGSGLLLGSHADKLAQHARVPVLVARDAAAFEHWASGTAELSVLLGVDFSRSAGDASGFLTELALLGRCRVTATYLYWPPAEWRRLGLSGIRGFLDKDPEVSRAIERDLRARTEELSRSTEVRLRAEPHLGSLGSGLVEMAKQEGAELIVVGSHARNAVRKIWEGSVSRGVLEEAAVSVLCVPSPHAAMRGEPHRPRSVLVATDFSSVGDGAVGFAYCLVADGGTVHLVHVVPRRPSDSLEPFDVFHSGPRDAPVEERLRALVPADASARQLTSELHVLTSHDVAQAIYQASERLGADLVCLGTRARGRVTKALLGSVAERVVSLTRRPILLTPPELE